MLSLSVGLVALLPTIWVVDSASGPGTHFTDLPAAVAAAQTGDTILVRAGNYSAFECTGKALTIRGSGSASTLVTLRAQYFQPVIVIDNVPVGQTFYMDGMRISPGYGLPFYAATYSQTPGMTVNGATSTVALADVIVSSPPQGIYGGPGLKLVAGTVTATRSSFIGGLGTDGGGISSGGNGGPGALLGLASVLVADNCTLQGGQGGQGITNWTSNYGGAGLLINGGKATLSQCNVVGGYAATQTHGAVGGDGVVAQNNAFVRASGNATCLIQGGAGSTIAGRAITTASGGSVQLHQSVTLVSTHPSGPVSGTINAGLPRMPTLGVAGTTLASGEVLGTNPVTVTMNSNLPNAPGVFLINGTAGFLNANSPLVLGEILLPLESAAVLDVATDGTGQFQFTFLPTSDIPGLLGIPIYSQWAVFDLAASQFRMSNLSIQVYHP